ncbi:MAG: phosphoribosylamine--glycine ligase [Myxococcota bacterium]|nr:phosphoribosylamine--glycine ligase [Myxococcota bacterium]
MRSGTSAGGTKSGASVLIVGGGAREHALAAALAAEGHAIMTAPGNPGTEALGRNAAVAADDIPGLVDLATRERPDLVVVGPELPLVLGLVDALDARGIRAFGPSRAAARLEGSKAFMKCFCERHAIPTASFAVFDDAAAAERHARAVGAGRPLVVKADGLAGGKGVVVANSIEESCLAIDRMMRKREFGAAGRRVVLEECLEGEEASFHVICDGTRCVPLLAAQDHKRVHDGDRGPNTGGMGAYAPAPLVGREIEARVMREVVEPTLAGMAAEGSPFRGVLFVGLMIDRGTPRVLEFNVRFGDPEATVLVPMYDGWFSLLDAAARGDLSGASPRAAEGAALAVVMAAAGYPASAQSGDPIHGLDVPLPVGAFVRHGGTKRMPDGSLVTQGGRVLSVGARGTTLEEAARLAYGVVDRIHWDGEHHRRDIGGRALRPPDPPSQAPAAHGEPTKQTKQTKQTKESS